jgi:hypothetical protein
VTEATLLPSAPVLEDGVDEAAYTASIARGRQILLDRDAQKWELGDIILQWAGAPGSDMAGLRKVAADLAIPEAYATMLRQTSYAFPPERRQADVPWRQHQHLIAEHELAEEMLRRYSVKREEQRPQRVNSTRLMDEVINEVRREKNIPQRRPRARTEIDIFTRHVNGFRRKWNHNQIPLNSIAEAEYLMESLNGLLADIRRAF